MSNIKYKHYLAIIEGDKIPRKSKKFFLGTILSKSKLNLLLKSVKLGEPIKTMYERRKILPFSFCPKCGCKEYSCSGNLSTYPEHWEKFNCLRCKKLVGYIDNSPFIHALECSHNNYDPSF